MKKCRYCKSEIDSKAKICPNCRKNQVGPVRRIVGAVILFIGICILVANCDAFKKAAQDIENSKFTLIDDYGYSDEYGFAYYIEGTVKNNTNKKYSYVQITLNTYDADGNLIGSCLDNINNFEANGTWKIKAICSGDAKSVKSYKLMDFTSW